MSWMGLSYEDGQLTFWEKTHHNLSGNRMRNDKAPAIRRDTAYLESLTPLEWFLGSCLAYGGLHRFGYTFRREPAQ